MRQCGFQALQALMVFAVCQLTAACGSSSAGGSGGSPGAGTGGASSGGAGGATGGGSGSDFTAVAPCATAAAYNTTGTTVNFGAAAAGYMPKCLKVSVGATVTFAGGGGATDTFSAHPLTPSATRGTTGNPITSTSTGTTKTFTFPTAGYYAYYCSVHGNDTTGGGWSGVIWVQ
jgi:plastocyanin